MKLLDYRQILGLHQLNEVQKLLLQATVLQGQAVQQVWDKWQSIVDLDLLDSGSDALLSRLYCNLLAHQIEHPHMARLKGIYKRNWYANQLALKKLATMLQVLRAASVAPIVLGDAAIALTSSMEFQPSIHDYSLLVRSTEREQTLSALQNNGWSLTEPIANQDYYEPNFNCQLQDRSQNQLRLQEQLFWAVPQEHTTEQLWARAVTCSLGQEKALRLNFTDLFLNLCLRAFYLDQTQQISCFVEAMTLLRQEEAVNWVDLVTQAQKYQTILPLRNMLTLLEQLFSLSLPEWILPALHQIPIGQKEFLQYQILPKQKRSILKSILYKTVNASQLITR
ncbi:MAG: nucleotidyltransferase family protein [Cyanobacteria bacterium J06600_6]